MSTIEQAIQRLETLRRAGVDTALPLPEEGAPHPAAPEPAGKPARSRRTRPAPAADSARKVDINLERLGRAGLVTPAAPRSPIAEEYRVIKRPLLANAQGRGRAQALRNGNLIMVTSALPGEGKTFTAVNLALSMAMELDTTVLLVDADVARPSILATLGIPDPLPGMMDVLLKPELDLSEVLLRTNVETLSLLPAGTPTPQAPELLASEAMEALLAEMATRYADRIIVFDSPPLLVTTEARALAAHMGQIAMVVEAGKTTHNAVREALAAVETCPNRMLVLNKLPLAGTERAFNPQADRARRYRSPMP